MSHSKGHDDLQFAPEPVHRTASQPVHAPWKMLIVDDEPSVHEITGLALKNFEFDGRQIEFLHAHSGKEARHILAGHSDIALALIDVVMEHEHAGLELVQYIRDTLKNRLVRIVLRTGQPGQAPERSVIRDYDINDYKEKVELTSQKLYSTVFSSLRSYRDLTALDANRRGLEHVIGASGAIFRISDLNQFIKGVLEQLVALLYLGVNSIYLECDTVAVENQMNQLSVVAATGCYAGHVGKNPCECLEAGCLGLVQEVLRNKRSMMHQNTYIGYFQPRPGREDVVLVSSTHSLTADDEKLIELFLHNVSIAYENALLRDEIEGTQRDMVYMLGEAIETRSHETGQHVRRVAEYCRLIALGIGLTEREAEILHIAAPLHDFGKIGIPDHILHKPGKLDEAEWTIMKSHARLGEEMLSRSEREILQAGAILAGQHHERWDGTGYPKGLQGENIHIFGRIGAVADVFDALAGRRSYKAPWPIEQIMAYFEQEKGKQFDPHLVDWLQANQAAMVAVLHAFPDELHSAHQSAQG